MSSSFPLTVPRPEIEIRIRQLAQTSGLAAATPTSLYSPPIGVPTVITAILLCNADGTTAQIGKVYHDEDGTTYSDATRIYHREVPAKDSIVLNELEFGMENSAGNLAVEDITGSKITCTLKDVLK